MKLTDEGLKAIKERNEKDAALYIRISDPGWVSHRDRTALLEHIEDTSIAAKIGGAFGTILGIGMGWAVVYVLFRWLAHDDIAAIAHWGAAHLQVVP